MRYTCDFCGRGGLRAGDRFCACCGAPQPTRSPSPTVRFFLSLLYAVLIWGVMFLVQTGINMLYIYVIRESLPSSAFFSDTAFYNAYWEVFPKYYAPVCIGCVLLLILIYTLFYTLRGKRFEREICLSKMPLTPAAGSFVFGAAAQVVVTVSIFLLSLVFPYLEESGAQSGDFYSLTFGGGSFLLEVLYLSLFVPFLEEIVFRGLIYTRLRKGMPVLAAQLLSALIFGAAHMDLTQFFYAFLTGFIMALLFEKYQSILPSLFFHMAFNGCSFLFQYLHADILIFALYFISISIVLFAIYFLSTKSERNPI